MGRYGAHFWLEVPEEYAGSDAHLPVPAFHAAGHEAQFVTIVASHDLVIVRLGRTRYPEAWDHPTFVRDVFAALDSTEAMSPGADGQLTCDLVPAGAEAEGRFSVPAPCG